MVYAPQRSGMDHGPSANLRQVGGTRSCSRSNERACRPHNNHPADSYHRQVADTTVQENRHFFDFCHWTSSAHMQCARRILPCTHLQWERWHLVQCAMLCGYVSLARRNHDCTNTTLIRPSQAEIYAAICVACMPSLANFWKASLEGTKVLTTIRSFLRSASSATRSMYSKNSKYSKDGNRRSSYESGSALRTDVSYYDPAEHPFPQLAANEDRQQQRPNEVHKMVTIHLSSQAASPDGDAKKVPVTR
jgi:hypothetical protein